MTLKGDTVSFESTSCVYTQFQIRRASLTTEVGIKARCFPHILVVLLPSGIFQDQIGKPAPSLGAKFGVLWEDVYGFRVRPHALGYFGPVWLWGFGLVWNKIYQVWTDGLPNCHSRGLFQILWDTRTTEFPRLSTPKSKTQPTRVRQQGEGAGRTSAFQNLPKIKINCF